MPDSIEVLHQKKKRETLYSSLLFTGLAFLSAMIPTVLRLALDITGPWAWFLTGITLLDLGAIVPVWIHYKSRIIEIDGGEEDAAAQY